MACHAEVRFAFSSNGDGFVFRDGTITPNSGDELERTLVHDDFPSPHSLWQKFCQFKGWSDAERIVVNVDTLYREFSGDTTPPDTIALFERMGRVYYERRA